MASQRGPDRRLERLVLGSVADKIVRASDVPVLVTPVLLD
jgi:nucleotide-binding universal stress UspA family protein